MAFLVALVIAIGFGVPVAVLSGAIAQGKAASSALEGIARQPEAAGKIQTAMFIGIAFMFSTFCYIMALRGR